jgi:hypothetical protein
VLALGSDAEHSDVRDSLAQLRHRLSLQTVPKTMLHAQEMIRTHKLTDTMNTPVGPIHTEDIFLRGKSTDQ